MKFWALIGLLVVVVSAYSLGIRKKISEKWISGGGLNSTHAWLVERAIRINQHFDEDNDPILKYFEQEKDTLKGFANYPDVAQNDQYTFRGHFYNPYTERNYIGMRKPTALTRFIEHNEKALQYEYTHPLFIKHVGMASHFLEDACQTYHAKNKIAFVTWHSEYERFSMKIQKEYEFMPYDLIYMSSDDYFYDIENILRMCSFLAYTLYDDASASSGFIKFNVNTKCFKGFSFRGTPDCEKWKEAAGMNLKIAQHHMGLYFARLIDELHKRSGK